MNKQTRINRLLNIYLPVFNEQQIIEGDEDMVITSDQAKHSYHFKYWLETWSDSGRRGELYELLRGK
jgi:hypothetical protein